MDAEKSKVKGSCLCGAVRLEVTLPSKFCTHCHCSTCRRAHGAAFVTWAGFRAQQVQITHGSDLLARYHTETDATRSFCLKCGSTLLFESPRWKGETHVALASLHGPIDRLPQGHFDVDCKAPWWEITDDLPQYGGETGGEPKKAAAKA